nr:MAG: hypothetical protein [Microvirus sp.]
MLFQTRYNHQKSIPEVNLGKRLVEKAGYIPAKDRIENMILAGQRLIEHRMSMYDFESNKELDESYYDPTRSKNFDMADAFQMQQNVENNIKQKELLKASQTAPEPSGEVLAPPPGYKLVPENNPPE